MSKTKKIVLVIVGVFLLLTIIGAAESPSKDKAKTAANKTQQTNQTKTSSQAPNKQSQPQTDAAAKQVADGIALQSTGFNYSADKSHITYGFLFTNTKQFTGTINIMLSGANGALHDALKFTENNLKAGAGDAGTATWSGKYDKYSYTVTVDGYTYSYPGGSILVND